MTAVSEFIDWLNAEEAAAEAYRRRGTSTEDDRRGYAMADAIRKVRREYIRRFAPAIEAPTDDSPSEVDPCG